jgi:hypothetical protein
MTKSITRNTKLYYYPLIRQNDRYVEAPESKLMGLDLPVVPELDDYLKRYYVITKGLVELRGRLYTAPVFIPIKGNDLCYVIGDVEGMPQSDQEDPRIDASRSQDYAVRLQRKLSFSESISPAQASYLKTEFMTPSFTVVNPASDSQVGECTWDEFVSKPRVVLMGPPGAGKTTCLRRLCLEIAEHHTEPSPTQVVPVYIQLRQMQSPDLLQEIQAQLSGLEAELLTGRLRFLLKSGRIFVVLDGLDEVPLHERHAIINSIKQLAEIYPRVGMVISTRDSRAELDFGGFNYLTIKPFSESKIKEWAYHRLYLREKKTWAEFVSSLEEQRDIVELASNPLMLATVEYCFRAHSINPKNRASLVGRFIEALVDIWDLVRGITRSTEWWAAPDTQISLLCSSAFNLRRSGRVSFLLQDFLSWEKDTSNGQIAYSLFHFVASNTGILRQSSSDRDSWSFLHETVTDYLAAKHVVERTDDATRILEDQMSDDRWREIWLYACGIAQDATHMVRLVVNSNKLDVTEKASLLLRAFAQNLRLSKLVLRQGCAIIVVAFLEAMKGVAVLDDSSTEANRWLWQIEYLVSHVEVEANRIITIREISRLIYYSRSGNSKDILRDMLLASGVDSVARFAACLDIDGYFRDEIETCPAGNIIRFYIVSTNPG